jgi:MYXO-CTERM domain-containing protein
MTHELSDAASAAGLQHRREIPRFQDRGGNGRPSRRDSVKPYQVFRWPLQFGLAWLAVCTVAPAAAAPSLTAYAGSVGGSGIGTVPGGCGNSPSPIFSFFSFNFNLPPEGIVPCGYSGAVVQSTAATGPVAIGYTLPPVSLGPQTGAGTFTGSGQAVANYTGLGASAHAFIGAGRPGGNTMFQSIGAATFEDSLTATSPSVVNSSAGFVRYQFSVDGSLQALGVPEANYFGETYMLLQVQHQGGPVFGVVNATVRRGGLATMSGGPPPAGWVTSTGSLSGSSTFLSVEFPMTWGQAWDVKAGLLAWAYGTADSNFLSTARLSGVLLFDGFRQPITDFSLSAASGTDYLAAPIPEPQTWALWLMGLAGLAGLRNLAQRRRRLPGI